MAKKFFNQKVKKKNNFSSATIVIGGIVGVLIVISIAVLISIKGSGSHKDAVIEIGDSVAVEINSDYPDKTLFFKELENVKESDIKVDYDKVKLDEIGSYGATIKVYGKSYEGIVNVVDTESPTLTVKDVTIGKGETYSPDDFVEKCNDNSKKKCNIEYYSMGITEDADNIDYSSYTKEGSYTIQIVASDESGNYTSPQTATLTIGKKSNTTTKPTNCKYGTSDYDSSKYNLAVDITNGSCAVDLNLYQNENTLKPVKTLISTEEAKLKKEFSKIKLNTKDIYLQNEYAAILNTTGNGIVGYSLYIEVSIMVNNKKEVIESYYVNKDGSRKYIVNKYL